MFRNAIKQFTPRPRVKSIHWVRQYIQTHEGRPYDHGAYPHLGAPGGPFDAFDDPKVKTIWLQFASRCGKTFFGSCCLLLTAVLNPSQMMFASSVEKLAVEVVARVYKMIERCKPLKRQLRPPSRRKQDRIDLDACKVWVAWSRSVSTLADKSVKVGLANEIDKWEQLKTSKEADPVKLFDDRFKEYPAHKKIKESTPSVKGKSRIERGRMASTNCAYYVPCPHCKKYQTLSLDRILWEKNDAGKSEPDLARATAYYQCEHCSEKIVDHHRGPMMRRGVWVPEGCQVNHEMAWLCSQNWGSDGAALHTTWKGWAEAPWIVGSPARDGTDAGYQISSLYALSLGWGDIAAEFVKCKDKPQDLRNFINQWKGETWEMIANKQTWQKLGERIIDHSLPRGVVPNWATFLTVGIDRQSESGARFPWVVRAWGPTRRGHTIAYGEESSFEQLQKQVVFSEWQYQDGNGALPVVTGLCDSGFRPDGVYDFCIECVRKGVKIWPAKGSNHLLNSEYERVVLGKNTSRPGMILYHVDTIRSQLQIEKMLHTLRLGDDGCTSVYKASQDEHQDYLEQLLNDAAIMDLDSHNNPRESWDRIDETIPNDFRDCERYAYVAMLMHTRGAPILARGERPPMRTPAKKPRLTMPDGRPFLLTQREG